MSKCNTLFSYFKKVPTPGKPKIELSKTKGDSNPTEIPNSCKAEAAKCLSEDEDVEMNSSNSSKENCPSSPKSKNTNKKESKVSKRKSPAQKPKRRRIIVASDSEEDGTEEEEEDMEDSDDEFKPPASDGSSSESDEGVISDEVDTDCSSSEPDSPVKKSRGTKRDRKGTAKKPATNSVQKKVTGAKATSPKSFTPSVGNKTMSKLASFAAPDTPSTASKDMSEERSFPHLKFPFLLPENIRDAEKHRPEHPDYSPKTLYVPDSFLNSQTPGMRQWWVLKAQHYDSVLFFKMGKFYELFHMDACIAVKELSIIYMRGDHAHAGFPEIAYGRYADQLIQKGYKVARIEQTETPDANAERVKLMKRSTKFDKVVRREVCSIQTKGTKRYSFIDGRSTDSSSTYLMAVSEKAGERDSTIYGVCFVETTIGKFYLGQFLDDRHSSRLRTLFSHHPPAHILFPRGHLSDQTLSLIKGSTLSVIQDPIRPETEFWEGSKTLKFLAEGDYFMEETTKQMVWPDALKHMISDTDSLGLTPGESYDLALSSLGAVVWHLMDSMMEEELLTIKDFSEYTPVDSDMPVKEKKLENTFSQQNMVLDGVTLSNLDVIVNGTTGTSEGTLLERLDHCSTAFGKRLLKRWLCTPPCDPDVISDRLDAVEDLVSDPSVTAEVTELMKTLPDLERSLSKIHTLGSASRSKNHPEGRAIFFEEVAYSKRKIEDFLSTLDGFKTAHNILKLFENSDFKSNLLRDVTKLETEGGKFADLSKELRFFDNAFDHEKAKSKGVINPTSGVDPEYDQALSDMKSLTSELDSYLKKQREILSCKSVSYFGTAKNRFQLEVPESALRKVPDSYEVTSQKKGYKRFRTPEIEDMLAQMIEAEDRRDAALKDTMRRIFFVFDKSYTKWSVSIQCMAVLDVLLSLATFSRCEEGVTCRPQFVLPSQHVKPFLELREARHPCFAKVLSSGDFIPNDTVIGLKDEREASDEDNTDGLVVLVTGPNMGGKSTLMRQVGIVVIIAQMGCYVPAEKCVLTPVDRVFTRLGASDRIMAGESTFFVELSETSAILQHATPHSLVLMDELGRGTATYDGTAIASAVVDDLSRGAGCRTLFSTHYHSLVESFSHDQNVRLGHMACMVENDEEDPSMENITFLYKFVKGICPKSYGFNAARLAAIPNQIIKVAQEKAQQFESQVNSVKCFMDICQLGSCDKAVVERIITQHLVDTA